MNIKFVIKNFVNKYIMIFVLISMLTTPAFGIDKKTTRNTASKDIAIEVNESVNNDDISCKKSLDTTCKFKSLNSNSTCEFNQILGGCVCNCILDLDVPNNPPDILRCKSPCTYVHRDCLRSDTFNFTVQISRESCNSPMDLCLKLLKDFKPAPTDYQACITVPQSTPAAEKSGSY